MAKQRVAQNWKTVETVFDAATGKLSEVIKNAGRFTQATVTGKMQRVAADRGYFWRAKPQHGFGGYWVHPNGDTIEVLPGMAA